jgi:hypothetical protein
MIKQNNNLVEIYHYTKDESIKSIMKDGLQSLSLRHPNYKNSKSIRDNTIYFSPLPLNNDDSLAMYGMQ